MGRNKRDKFERIYTDSEDNTTTDEESDSVPQINVQNASLMEVSETVFGNENNSNSLATTKKDKQDQFLITRSKRMYNKPELKFKLKERVEGLSDPNDLDKVNSKVNGNGNGTKRETIKSLNTKIADANSFLAELNKKMEDRDREINSLKQAISKDRSSEIENLLRRPERSSKKLDDKQAKSYQDESDRYPVFHDFPVMEDEEIELQVQDEEMDIDFPEETRKRNRSKSKSF